MASEGASRRKSKKPAGGVNSKRARRKDEPSAPTASRIFHLAVAGGAAAALILGLWAAGFEGRTTHTSTDGPFGDESIPLDASRTFDPNRIDINPNLEPDPLEILREKFNVSMLSENPPIYQFEHFLTDEEANGIIELASGMFKRSTTGLDRDKTDLSRTSSTAWLIDPSHYSNPLVKRIENRMASAMNVPAINQEGFQVLEYQLSEYYREHHDFLPEMTQWPCGVRLATFFLYLSDVEEGGGTWFPRLNVTGVPKKGRALLWYNVQKDASGEWKMDGRTQHEAVPVIKGTKYAANKWIHVKDWVTPWRAGRTG